MADNILTDAEKDMERRERVKRREKLFKILKQLEIGEMDSSKSPMTEVLKVNPPRQEYISQKERSNFNYGYMEMSEIPE